MLHKNSHKLFATHKGTDVFFFTPDGQHFFTEGEANSHAIGLSNKKEKANVEKAERKELPEADVAASGTGKLTELEQAQLAFETAKNKVVSFGERVKVLTDTVAAAQSAFDGLDKDAKPIVKTNAKRSLEKATATLEKAGIDLKDAQTEADEAEQVVLELQKS
jgi:sporulation-control protein spo0M